MSIDIATNNNPTSSSHSYIMLTLSFCQQVVVSCKEHSNAENQSKCRQNYSIIFLPYTHYYMHKVKIIVFQIYTHYISNYQNWWYQLVCTISCPKCGCFEFILYTLIEINCVVCFKDCLRKWALFLDFPSACVGTLEVVVINSSSQLIFQFVKKKTKKIMKEHIQSLKIIHMSVDLIWW